MPKYHPGKPVVLYVDDNPDDHFLLQHSVLRTETPFQIQSFFSGEPALAYLRGGPPFADRWANPWPALMLCDYDLGLTRGSEVVSAVRAIPLCHTLPLIIFSDADDDNSAVKCYAAGADYFLSKPSLPHRLNVIVQTLYACASGQRCFDVLTRLPEYHAKPAHFRVHEAEHRMVA